MSRTRYIELDDRNEDVRELMRARPREATTFLDRYELSWIYHENALEGLVVTHQELLQGLSGTAPAPDTSTVHAFQELRNQRDAIEFVKHESRSKALKINLALVKKIYEILYQGLPHRMPVTFRRDMPLHRVYFHDIVQPVQIQPGLEQLFELMQTTEFQRMHPIRQATHSHHRFMELFPFSDASGKVGRLLMNLMLIRHGYMPVIVHSADREQYYEGLRLPATQFGYVIMDAMDNSLDNAFKFFLPKYDEVTKRVAV